MDPDTITLDPARAVFDVDLLKQVGRVAHERSFRRPDSGHNVGARVYALAGILYCAHCDRLAAQQNNPLLRTRLIGKGKSAKKAGVYRHRPGLECGSKHKQVQAGSIETDFMRLCEMLSLSDEAQEALSQFATTLSDSGSEDTDVIEQKKASAIAKIQRKLDAARHLYEEGEISREDFLARKQTQEAELERWQNYTTEARQMHVELMLCAEAFNQLVGLWSTADDEGRQTLARGLFEEIVFDLDAQMMVSFKLKPWAERFLVVRGMQGGVKGTALPPAGDGVSAILYVADHFLALHYEANPPPRLVIRARDAEIARHFAEGLSKTAVGRLFSISPRRVGQVLREYGHGMVAQGRC